MHLNVTTYYVIWKSIRCQEWSILNQKQTYFEHSKFVEIIRSIGCSKLVEIGSNFGCSKLVEIGSNFGCSKLVEIGSNIGCLKLVEIQSNSGCSKFLEIASKIFGCYITQACKRNWEAV